MQKQITSKIITRLFLCGFLVGAATAAPALSPAEAGIEKAKGLIAKQPDHVPYYTGLAMAYARRAREISDVKYYAKAEETLDQALKLSPDNFEALKVRTWLQLGRHEFARALEGATKLNQRVPDDVTVYGYMADANAELGNYKAAVENVQWMLNIKPGNAAALTRASYLRELHGDIPGAIELMDMAYESTPLSENEDRAWLQTQIAHLNYVAGNLNRAERHAQDALTLFPEYHYALGVLAQIRTAQGKYEEAAQLLQARYTAAPHAENQFALAEALLAAGSKEEAARHFAEFEKQSLAESNINDNSNHELIFYYTDIAHEPGKALSIARAELARRHDVFTLDAYAWALEANGDHEQARAEYAKAIATGVLDPKIREHASVLAAR